MAPEPFEVLLASFMSNSAKVAELLERTGTSTATLTELRTRFGAQLLAPPSIDFFASRLPRAGIDDEFDLALSVPSDTRRHRFSLSLWAAFDLGVLVGDGGPPYCPHFVRKRHQPPPDAIDIASLSPWGTTVEEVFARFGEPATDERWDFARWICYGPPEACMLTFDLGLLQEVVSMPEGIADLAIHTSTSSQGM
ncbi:MAG: hypothetical protein U0324_24470 [Polyangiales bacterium]